jgi:Ca-activated chloride channel family protein
MLESITNKGNGVYHYIDSMEEARVVFLRKLMGNLVTIAKDVKVQVEFNPAQVRAYRLLGYANRMLRKEDFSNDRIDAGDIGSGHTVTAFYEIQTGDARHMPPAESLRYATPADVVPAAPAASREWLNVKLRYKQPEGARSTLMTRPFTGISRDFPDADVDFRFGASVAMAAMILRGTEGMENSGFEQAGKMAAAAQGPDPHGNRAEFTGLLTRLATNAQASR